MTGEGAAQSEAELGSGDGAALSWEPASRLECARLCGGGLCSLASSATSNGVQLAERRPPYPPSPRPCTSPNCRSPVRGNRLIPCMWCRWRHPPHHRAPRVIAPYMLTDATPKRPLLLPPRDRNPPAALPFSFFDCKSPQPVCGVCVSALLLARLPPHPAPFRDAPDVNAYGMVLVLGGGVVVSRCRGLLKLNRRPAAGADATRPNDAVLRFRCDHGANAVD